MGLCYEHQIFWEVFVMSRFDNFLDALSAGLVVAVLVAVVIAVFYLSQFLPFGILFPVLIFLAGAAIGAVVSLYASGFFEKRCNTK